MPNLPSLFVPHGAPMFAAEPGVAGALLADLGRKLPRPAAILVVSPHWMSAVPTVSSVERQTAIHDFSGFPAALYELGYDAAGAPHWAAKVAERLAEAGLPVETDTGRGLDHGAWIPLRYMYPAADVPVFQCSLIAGTPRTHYDIGRALAPLRAQGLLIVGSGNLTHNFADFELGGLGSSADRPIRPHVPEFQAWMTACLREHRLADLLAYRQLAPHAQRAHPSDEHLMPLYVALGAAAPDYRLDHLDGGVLYAGLAMDGFVFND